ncbi:MAG: hypothetical protein M1839_003266 [Geoglossum umbratile]|nr:MAG: hypothetical protein M1839_003266 [Geoglossum umbratile]
MLCSELDTCASLFNLLSTRRDADILVFELLGRYNVDRLTGSPMPEEVDRLTFSLACQLGFTFDLQRTHLQSRTPFGGRDTSSLTDRLPYLLSLRTAKGVFKYLSSLARGFISRFGGQQESDISSKRNVFLRTLVSGTRMLCLHPAVSPGEMVVPEPIEGIGFSFWESVLIEVCDQALNRVPKRHPGLQLPRMGRQMFPMDDSRLMTVVAECTTDFHSDYTYKYWVLYDISCSVVTAYIQHREIALSGAEELLDENAEILLGNLAAKIAESVITEAVKVYKSPGTGERCTVLLMDIVEVLNPILKEQRHDACKSVYENILLDPRYREHSSIYEVQDTCKSSTLKKFQEALKQRAFVLHDSDNELPALLSNIEQECLEITNAHVIRPSRQPGYSNDGGRVTESLEHLSLSPATHPSGDGRAMETLRLYAANCESTHIFAHGPTVSGMVEDAREHQQTWDNGSLSIPLGAICPFCPRSPEPSRIYNLREITPLTQVLSVANRKRQELVQLRGRRGAEFIEDMATTSLNDPIGMFTGAAPGPVGLGINRVPLYLASPRSPLQTTFSPENRIPDIPEVVPFDGQFYSTPVRINPTPSVGENSGWRGLRSMIRMGRRSDTTSTTSGPPPSGGSSLGHIDFTHLQQEATGEPYVTLSADCQHLIAWNNKNLALYDVSGRQEIQEVILIPSPVKDPAMVLASRSYCAIVRRDSSNDEASIQSSERAKISFYDLVQFNCVATHKVQGSIWCLALSPDDTHAAVGLANGTVQVLKLDQHPHIIAWNLPTLGLPQLRSNGAMAPPSYTTAPVVALSFSPDASQLAASVRKGRVAGAYTSQSPFASCVGPWADPSVGEREDDDQGVSSTIYCPVRNLLCITYWTRSGITLLFDCTSKKSKRLDRRTIRIDIGTRMQQAIFSKSGNILILINNIGSIFKITINDIDHIRAEEIGKSRRLSRVVGKSQILDMKISEDESSLKVAWVKNNKLAIVNSYAL